MIFKELKELREEAGLSQAAFAPYLGIRHQEQYSRLESGRHRATRQHRAHVAALQVIVDNDLWGEFENCLQCIEDANQ